MQHFVWIPDERYHDINPLLFGYEACPPNHSYGPAIDKKYLIYYIVSGKGLYRANGKSHTLSAGYLFVIKPGEEVFFKADKDEPWSYIWIGFNSKKELPVSLPNTLYYPKAQNIFNAMKKCRKLKSGRSAYLSARLWDFFALLMDNENNYIRYIDDALDYMNANFMHSISVNELADRLGLERTYFSALFKKRTGYSPKQYLVHYRMEIAASLLVDEKHKVSDVAKSVGYPDLFSFSKAFKAFIGCSPTEFISMSDDEQFKIAKAARLKFLKHEKGL